MTKLKYAVAGAAISLAILLPRSGYALWADVWCDNCSTAWDQVNQYVRQAEQLQQELQTATNTLHFYENAVTNTINLPSSVYRDMTGDVQNFASLLQKASLLSANAQRLLGNLSSPGGYPTSALANWRQQFTTENNACSDSITNQASLLTYQFNQLGSDASTLGSLQSEVMGASGRQQSLQSLGGISATIGQLLTKLQGTIAGTSQSTVTCEMARMDRQALLDKYDEQQFKAATGVSCASLAQFGGAASECGGN